jgi:hypothetical protein
MKVGDKLYCHREFHLEDENKWFTVGKIYIVIDIIDDSLIIEDDEEDGNAFSYKSSNDWKYFGDYFYSNKDYRKEKLKKLNQMR